MQRVYALLLESHLIRERLIGMEAANQTLEAERQVYLGLTLALEDGLRRSLEEAVSTLRR